MTAKKETFKAKLEENRVYLSYFGVSGDTVVEGMEIINKQTGDLLSVIYEYPKESMTDKTVLAGMAESVHYFDANTPVSIFSRARGAAATAGPSWGCPARPAA